jgi:hypothetical protein
LRMFAMSLGARSETASRSFFMSSPIVTES